MKLSDENKAAVARWIAEGASIADVQKRIQAEFGVSLTYIDTRFLIDDLGLTIKTLAPPPPVPKGVATPAAPANDPDLPVEDPEVFDDVDDDDPVQDFDAPVAGTSTVKVEVDRVMRPGTVVSGSVTFSDGQAGKWALDQFGRLMFEGTKPGYRPSPTDLEAFQREVSQQLQRHGY